MRSLNLYSSVTEREYENICFAENGYDISGIRIIHEPDIEKSVEMAVRMLSSKAGRHSDERQGWHFLPS